MTSSARRILSLTLMALLVALALPGAASARSLVQALDGGCPDVQTSQAFARWADPLQYAPVAGGDFESGAAGWTLSGGAGVVAGNEPFNLAPGSHALRIPAGAAATSPAVCLGVTSPTARFVVRAPASLLARLTVEVVLDDGVGVVKVLPVSLELGLLGGWRPSLPVLIVGNLFAALPEGATAALRFKASGGAFSIDDVYVDPYGKR